MPRIHRPVALVAVLGGGFSLVSVVVGLVLIGLSGGAHEGVGQDAITALATIGGSLAGGFAGWFGHGMRGQTNARDGREE